MSLDAGCEWVDERECCQGKSRDLAVRQAKPVGFRFRIEVLLYRGDMTPYSGKEFALSFVFHLNSVIFALSAKG